MPDREKVLKALEHHKETAVCNGCPYAGDDDTPQGNCPIYDDALALLREQEPIRRSEMYFCGDCKTAIARTMNYCHKCGRKVNWNAAD